MADYSSIGALLGVAAVLSMPAMAEVAAIKPTVAKTAVITVCACFFIVCILFSILSGKTPLVD